jgi:hypothetical protein
MFELLEFVSGQLTIWRLTGFAIDSYQSDKKQDIPQL